MKKTKKRFKDSDTNIFWGCIYLIISSLLIISTLFSAPTLLLIRNFFGLGIYALILFFIGLTLKNLNLTSNFTNGYSKFAQIALVFVLAALGYSFFEQKCEITIINLSIFSCSLEFISGNRIIAALGTEASRILLIVITLILVPVALNISFENIHFVLNFIVNVVSSTFGFIGIAITTIIDKFQDLIYYLEQKRIQSKDQRIINRSEMRNKSEKKLLDTDEDNFEDDVDDQDNYNWVNPMASRLKRTKDEENEETNSFEHSNENKKFVKHSEIEEDEDNVYHEPASKTSNANIITAPESIKRTDVEDAIVSIDGLEYPDWQLPSLKLLDKYENIKVDRSDVKQNIERIERTYESFNMKVEVVNAVVGPTVTQYQMNIATGVSVRAIITRQPDVALALGVNGIRIEPIPGQSLIGLEVPNRNRITVKISEIMEELRKQFKGMRLGCVLGKSIDNKPILMDLQKMPHVLVAGTTGSGKSVLTNSIIMSLLMTKSPDELKLILVDPKKVEFSDYNDIPHLLTPVIVENEKVMNAIKWAVEEMERRYTLLSNYKVRNIEGYNEKVGFTAMPYIVIIIDEVADLMSSIGKAFEAEVLRIAQKARATGIHLVLATQRPSVDVITGVLKGNIPGRIALKVASQQDSRVIIDRNGAEALVGYGDLLYGDPGKASPLRVQGVWVDQKEVQRVVDFIVSQVPDEKIGQNYKDNIVAERWDSVDDKNNLSENQATTGLTEEDSTFNEALKVILQANRFSTSLLQTYLKIGFNKASRLKMELETQGYIVPSTTKSGAFEINKDKIQQKLNESGSNAAIQDLEEEYTD